jgi:hypothetical protein
MIVELRSTTQAKVLMGSLWAKLKPALEAGKEFTLEIRPLTRTLDQNAKFHAICSDVARSGHQYMGKARDSASWKTLFVSGHAVAFGDAVSGHAWGTNSWSY